MPRKHVMISARFLNDVNEKNVRETEAHLRHLGINTYIVSAGAGEQFGPMTRFGLQNMVVMIAFLTDDYGAKTSSPYCSYVEVTRCYEDRVTCIPVLLCQQYPPRPDGDSGEATANNAMLFRQDLVLINWFGKTWDAKACAEEIASHLRSLAAKNPSLSKHIFLEGGGGAAEKEPEVDKDLEQLLAQLAVSEAAEGLGKAGVTTLQRFKKLRPEVLDQAQAQGWLTPFVAYEIKDYLQQQQASGPGGVCAKRSQAFESTHPLPPRMDKTFGFAALILGPVLILGSFCDLSQNQFAQAFLSILLPLALGALVYALVQKEEARKEKERQEKQRRKKVKAAVKEGGKKGVELAGCADMGGLEFFTTALDAAEGDLELLQMAMDAANKEVDPTDEEAKGGSGAVGKMLLSSGDKQLALLCYVPTDKVEKINASEWMKKVLESVGGQFIEGHAVAAKGTSVGDGSTKFPLKDKDTCQAASVNYLKEKAEEEANKPSAAKQLIDFYGTNQSKLYLPLPDKKDPIPWERSRGRKGWEKTHDSLFLGFTTSLRQECEGKYQGKPGVLVVDVAPEFEPEIRLGKPEDARIIMFVGKTGAGKSTQINAFFSYLLGGDIDDSHRVMLIDDRLSDQNISVTQYITVFRIRPISERFKDQTLYLVDSPGFCDTSGHGRDQFIRAAMGQLFNTISHINAIVLTSKASVTRKTPDQEAAITYIFQLFSKDVRGCLRTILTYCDGGNSPAIDVLKSQGWPITKETMVEVNNSAFKVGQRDDCKNAKVREWWNMSTSGQFQVMRMLSQMPNVPTNTSAQVVDKRMTLQERCELAEGKILQRAKKTHQLIANMGAIASAVGAAPGQKVLVKKPVVKQIDVEAGKHIILCGVCNHTCHAVCACGGNGDKKQCCAMNSNGYCTVCPKKCHWTKHTASRFILECHHVDEWIVPEELIRKWNSANTSLEGSLLGAIDEYLQLQDSLVEDMQILARLTQELQQQALQHDSEALLNYVNSLIASAKAQGASVEQQQALWSAKNALLITIRVGREGVPPSVGLLRKVIDEVKKELKRRTKLGDYKRAEEEEKTSKFYNGLLKLLPQQLREKEGVPGKLPEGNLFSTGAKFNENLKQTVKLVEIVLKTESILQDA